MGGEKETTVKSKSDTTSKIGDIRIHQSGGEAHFHDDTNKLKVAMPIATWWKIWDQLRNDACKRSWPDPVNKTTLLLETTLDQNKWDVTISITQSAVSKDWSKIDEFTKRK